MTFVWPTATPIRVEASVTINERRLAVGERTSIRIDAREKNNRLGIRVAVGDAYTFSASGQWFDASIRCGPDGYEIDDVPSAFSRWTLRLFQHVRRVPSARYFALIVCVDADEETAIVASRLFENWRPARDGSLVAFANDVGLAYRNNSGAIDLTVTRLA